MKSLIEGFAGQMEEAIAIGEAASLSQAPREIRNVVLTGLGGSAFGGEIIKNYIQAHCPVPFAIVRDYAVPAFISEHTLLIVSSYSGNTEETLSAFEMALEKNPMVVCISSGGKVVQKATEAGFDYIQLPGGYPPRAACGFSITQQLYVLRHFGLIPDFKADLEEAHALIRDFQDHEAAKNLATATKDRIPVLYSSAEFESVVIRWRQQIEENGKHIAFHHVVPEMNHNELVGWKNPADLLKQSVVFFFRSNLDHERVLRRMDLNKDIIAPYAAEVLDLESKGTSRLGQLFYWLHLGDWVSYYLAELNEEDPTPVKVIDFLKGELAKA